MRAIRSGALQPLDTSKLTNFKNLAPQLQSPSFNTEDGKHYGISFMWGANVLIYNKKSFPTAPDSWSVIYDSKNKGKITVPDNPIQIADPALQFFGAAGSVRDLRGHPQPGQGQAQAAAVSLVRKYWVLATDFEQLFKSGDAVVGAGWPLMTNDLKKAGLPVAEVIPKEGVTGWSDSWMLSKDAKNPICAYKYMNYVTSPDVQKQVADVTGYSPANTKTCEVVGPQRCKDLHITDSHYYDSIKYWKTPEKPTNYRQWTDAWGEVKG